MIVDLDKLIGQPVKLGEHVVGEVTHAREAYKGAGYAHIEVRIEQTPCWGLRHEMFHISIGKKEDE